MAGKQDKTTFELPTNLGKSKETPKPAAASVSPGRALEKMMIGTLSMQDWEPRMEDVRRGLGYR